MPVKYLLKLIRFTLLKYINTIMDWGKEMVASSFMRNTGDLRLVSGLNCGGCILLSFAEWEEVTREGYNKEQQQGGYKSVTDFVLLQNNHLLGECGCICFQGIEVGTTSYSFTSISLTIPVDSSRLADIATCLQITYADASNRCSCYIIDGY